MEEEELEECNTSLNLGIGLGEYVATKNNAKQKKNNKRGAGVCLDFSLSPQLVHHHQPKEEVINIDDDDDDDGLIKNMHQLVWGSKRKIEEEEQDDKKSSSNKNNIDEYYYSNDIHNNISKDKEKEKNCGRKKLRLNKEQSTLLEDSFKQHTSLNAGQKQALAEKLNLQPRQVEVWFQNRRARTKLKQTEVEWELLKKWCQALTEENRRLKKELQELTTTTTTTSELKQLKPPLSLPLPLYIQLSRNNNIAAAAAATTTLTVCASCQNFVKAESTHVDVVLPNSSPPN